MCGVRSLQLPLHHDCPFVARFTLKNSVLGNSHLIHIDNPQSPIPSGCNQKRTKLACSSSSLSHLAAHLAFLTLASSDDSSQSRRPHSPHSPQRPESAQVKVVGVETAVEPCEAWGLFLENHHHHHHPCVCCRQGHDRVETAPQTRALDWIKQGTF